MPSRRSYLAALATVAAGCSGSPESSSTPGPTTSPAGSPSPAPTGTPTSTPSDEVEPLPADDPALAWAVRLPQPMQYSPTVDPGRGRVFVGGGDESFGGAGEIDESASGVVFALDAADGSEAWRAPTDAPIAGQPVAHDGRLHTATGYSNGFYGVDNRIVAYGPDGARLWTTGPHGKFLSIVAAHEGSVFVGTNDDALGPTGETVFAVGSDGSVRWEREAGDGWVGTVVNGTLLYSEVSQLTAYDLDDGTVRWESPGEPLGNPTAGVAVAGGLCFTQAGAETDDGYRIVARSTVGGAERWRYSFAPERGGNFVPTGVAAMPASTTGGDGPGLVGTEYGGTVFALDVDGTERWTFAADAKTGRPVVGDAVYVGDADGTVYALEPDDGSVRWRVSFAQFPDVWPMRDGILALSSSEREQVLASIGADGSERWRFSTSKRLGGAAVGGERVYAGANDGTLFALGA